MPRGHASLVVGILSAVLMACATPTVQPKVLPGQMLLDVTPSPSTKPTAGPTAPAIPASGSAVPLAEVVKVGPSGATAFLASSPPNAVGPNAATRTLSAGMRLLVAGPDQTVNGHKWKDVRDPSGNRAWVVTDSLAPIPAGFAPNSPTASAGNPSKTAQIEFAGQFDRDSLPVGGKLSLTIGAVNRGNRAIGGLRIYTEGPWATLIAIRIVPDGAFSRGNPGSYEIRRNKSIQPGETVSMTVVAFASEPGNLTFSFVPFDLDGTLLRAPDGESRSIGGMITVYR